jgi:hypothetical protein
VCATGESARALATRLLALDDAVLAQLRGVAGTGLLLVLGAPELLPWVDGVAYLGRDPDAPSLLLPTALAPDVPVALLERALAARVNTLGAPLAVLDAPARLVPAADARPIERARLSAFRDSASPP